MPCRGRQGIRSLIDQGGGQSLTTNETAHRFTLAGISVPSKKGRRKWTAAAEFRSPGTTHRLGAIFPAVSGPPHRKSQKPPPSQPGGGFSIPPSEGSWVLTYSW